MLIENTVSCGILIGFYGCNYPFAIFHDNSRQRGALRMDCHIKETYITQLKNNYCPNYISHRQTTSSTIISMKGISLLCDGKRGNKIVKPHKTIIRELLMVAVGSGASSLFFCQKSLGMREGMPAIPVYPLF